VLHPSLFPTIARFGLGLTESNDLIDAAHAVMDDGHYSYSLGELATQYRPNPLDSRVLFASALEEIGATIPSQIACIEILLESEAIEIHEGRKDPFAALHRLFEDPPLTDHPEYDDRIFRRSESWSEWRGYYSRLSEYRDYGFHAFPNRRDFSEDDPEYLDLVAEFTRFGWNWIVDRNRPFLRERWTTADVMGIAAGIRDERAFDQLPILADALEDAGCVIQEWLDHLRWIRTHDRTCWIVDLLLSRPT
jgi:hypothetical protein